MPTPIIIGVGDLKNPSIKPEDAREPASLMLSAINAALHDTEAKDIHKLVAAIDGISVVRTWTWPYADLPALLAQRLGTGNLRHKQYTDHGGNLPAKILDETARRISCGEVTIGIIVGGEALGSLAVCVGQSRIPPKGWTSTSEDLSSASALSLEKFGDNIGTRHHVGLPIHVYPMYENAFRANRKQSLRENHVESTELYANFEEIASKNENSWNYGKSPKGREIIGSVSKSNRMICSPYPLLMNAFNNVNLAAATILTSVELAKEFGIPEHKWIYPLGGAGTRDSEHFWERPNFYSSPSISRSLDSALQVSGLETSDIDLFDIYSCFPIVPKLACEHLGIPIDGSQKPVTLLGGLTSFGGAGNNYSMHAITEMTRRLRRGQAKNGLILANGGTVTYQHAICLSSHPRRDAHGYPCANPLPEMITDVITPKILDMAYGDAVIETYTVEYQRDGNPSIGFIVGRLKNSGDRFVANHGDASTLQQLASKITEPIGKKGIVKHDKKSSRNLFFLDGAPRL